MGNDKAEAKPPERVTLYCDATTLCLSRKDQDGVSTFDYVLASTLDALEAKHAAELAKTAQMLDWLRRVVRCEPVDAPVTCPRCSANVAGFSNVLHTAGGAGLCGACWSVRAVKAELDLAEARAVIAAREADIRRALGAADTAIAPWVRELLRGCPSAPAPAPIAPNPPSVVTSPELYGPRPRTREHCVVGNCGAESSPAPGGKAEP